MKRCFKCSSVKPLTEFYAHPRMADGHLNKCKSCTRKDVQGNRAARLEHYRLYDRERGREPGRRKFMHEHTKDKAKRMGPMYIAAHNKVTRALRNGDLVRPGSCSRCPATKNIQAHHDDYSKPLDVMWLCPVCHAARHKELGRLRTMATLYGEQPDPFPHIIAVRDSEPGHRSDATGTNLSGAAPETATTSKESA